MQLKEYQQRAKVTDLKKNDRGGLPDLAYHTLGLCDEAVEVWMSAPSSDPSKTPYELGDVLWYASMIAYDIGWDFALTIIPTPDEHEFAYGDLLVACGRVAGLVKKGYRDSNGVFHLERVQMIEQALSDVVDCLTAIAGDLGYTLETIADMNIQKLADRAERNKIHGDGDKR